MPEDTQTVSSPPPANQERAPSPVFGPSGETTDAPKKRTGVLWIVLGLAAVVLIAGVIVWHYLSLYQSTDDAEVDGHLNAISARVSGYVSKVDVDDNQLVKKGDVLVEIDPRDFQVAVDHAKADLADAQAAAEGANLNVPVTTVGTTTQVSSSQADVDSAQAGVSAAQQQADAARAQLQSAEASNVRAQADLTRYADLVAKDEVSRQTYEASDAEAKSAAADVAAARANVSAADQAVNQAKSKLEQAQAGAEYSRTGPQQVGVMRARARSAGAAVQQKQAALEAAELDLQYCTVTAPVDGVVSKNVEVGMNVQPGQTLLSVVPLDDVWITANFKETQLQNMRPGQRVTFTVDAFSREYHGHVDSIAGASGARFSLLPPENATGNYVKVVQRVPVKIVLDPGENNDHLLRVGMSVEPKVWLH